MVIREANQFFKGYYHKSSFMVGIFQKQKTFFLSYHIFGLSLP